MTSAQTFSGIGDRSSSRVLAPPGGGQSFNLFGGGHDAPAPSGGRRMNNPPPQQHHQQENRPAAYDNRQPQHQQQQQHQRQPEVHKQPPPQSLQQNPEYNGGNGSGLHAGRSSTRLHAPPGGQSSMASLLSGGNDQPTDYGRGRRDPNASSFQQTNAQRQQNSGRSNGNILTWQ